MKRKRSELPEAKLQIDAVRWLKETMPELVVIATHNESAWKRVNFFKLMGLCPGASDIIIVGLEQVIFVEFKSETGRLSKDQISFKMKIEELGHKFLVIRYLSDLKRFFGYFD